MIPRNESGSTGHQIYLGKVESISGDKITFTSPVNKLPFVIGDILKTAVNSNLTGTGMEISGITDRKQFSVQQPYQTYPLETMCL